MRPEKHIGFDKAVHDALVEARGKKFNNAEDRIKALEHKLETCRLSPAEVAEIQKQLKSLR
ncbi:MAG: hypothetical protein PHH47_04205 [Gallionella sp.]|nr:hypothetical protein [Gallionella sp.]MDD4945598.1 hypothetical protein [Gallionella sp.]MDD5612053.1 hypothetical protein [Gallionella sp.]